MYGFAFDVIFQVLVLVSALHLKAISMQTHLWREVPGLGVLGVIGGPHCVDVTQHLKYNRNPF